MTAFDNYRRNLEKDEREWSMNAGLGPLHECDCCLHSVGIGDGNNVLCPFYKEHKAAVWAKERACRFFIDKDPSKRKGVV